jgi:hypothetical protein
MFQRNIRLIWPWKLAQIIALLKGQVEDSKWASNQRLQNQFIKALEAFGLKRGGVQYDPKSGGARTYIAQLRSLGLVFKREKKLYLTIAGEDMANGKAPLPILQEMLFRNQFPSVYSRNVRVKIHPSIKVKPFLFVLELMHKTEYLTTEELVIPVVYGHNNSCLDACFEKIKRMRSGDSLNSVIDSPDHDLYTPGTPNRNIVGALEDVYNIALTCKCYLQATGLIDVKFIDGKHRMNIAAEYSDKIDIAISTNEKFISGWDSEEEAFQRKLGCWDRIKDTRKISDTEAASPSKDIISAHFFRFAGTKPITKFPSEFVNHMTADFGFKRDEVEQVINPLLPEVLNFFESTYLDLAKSGGEKYIEFEKATGNLFSERLEFEVEPTGQKKRPNEIGGYSDLFLIALDDYHCAIIDTKSTATYSLNANDYLKMANSYIPSYMELSPDKNMKLEFCSYVAGGFSSNIDERLNKLKSETGIPVSAISAHNLLRVCSNKCSQDDLRATFAMGRKLDFDDFKTKKTSA